MTTFVLTEEQGMIRELAGDLARGELRSRSEEVDHHGVCPKEGLRILSEAGLLTCMTPEVYGGAELDYWSQVCVVEEVAKECGSTAWAVATGAEVAECILRHGSDQQKDQVLPGLAAGGCASAALCTEVTAQKTPEGYLLRGSAENIPNAGACDWYLICAQEGNAPRWFLLSGDQAGLSAAPQQAQLGMKGCPLGTLSLDCAVGLDAAVAGNVQATLHSTQALHMAAMAAGIAQGALGTAIQYVNERVQFGKTIAQFENTQQVMAELLAKVEAARALVWCAVQVKDSGADYACIAAMAKIAATDIAAIATRKCVQFMGGYGYSREYPVERKMRDAKMTELLGGASALQKELVAKAIVVH